MIMGIGLGVGINRSNYAQGIFNAYSARVVVDGGITEGGACVDAVSGLLLNASLLLIPSGYKGGKLYSEIPTNGNGDLTWTRASTANRTNASGNIELMGTGVPRLSYMYGSCPAVLAEPQRTNLALYSAQFDDSTWFKGGATITSNATTSPDGTTTADKLVAGTNTGIHNIYQVFNIATSATYTASIYAKKSEYTAIRINYQSSGTSFISVNLDSGVIASTGGTSYLGSSITNAGNGWYRITMTFTAPTGSNNLNYVIENPVGTISFTGDGTSGIFIWGAQFEQGAYPTTYIPTTTATATRVVDSFSRNNIFTNGLITSSGGTWFVELRGNVAYTGGITQAQLLGLGNDVVGATANNFYIACSDATRVRIWKQVAGTISALYTTTTDTTKIAIKWNGTSCDVFANGAKVVSATSFTTTALESLRTAAVQHPYFIQQMALHPEPLTDAKLIELTTL